MTKIKSTAIARAGHEYQDLIGIQKLLDFYRAPAKYRWIQLESEDDRTGYLDDVVAALKNGTFDLTQVKFTADPANYFLDWEWLLEKKPKGSSLLCKWSATVNRFTLGNINTACLRTNRIPDTTFLSTLNADGRVDFDKLDAAIQKRVETETGSAAAARKFFHIFQFLHSQPMLDELEDDLRDSVVPTDTDMPNWLSFLAQAKRWAMVKNLPAPDGRITHGHLTQYITREAPKPIPQGFEIPAGYAVPGQTFHKSFIKRVQQKSQISVLWGTPGRGKSTYLSFLVRALRKARVPVVRHHYFLSLDDPTGDRFSFNQIAASLMDQMIVYYPEAVKGLKETPNQLRKWLEACGAHFEKKKRVFLVVVDGLDHVWRERRNLDQLNHLFEYLLPLPRNVGLSVGTQRITHDKLPVRLLKNLKKDDWIEIPAMDELSVQSWTTQQYKAKRLRLPKRNRLGPNVEQQIGSVGTALFEISRGHPLHLIYSFETLVRQGNYIDADAVNLLPECPDGDINQYYELLWGRLSQEARKIIHLIAGSNFHWPHDGLVRTFGQLDEVDFLLEHRRIGLVPFHGSILAFAREKANHKAVFGSLLPRVLNWLRKDAPEYWRWGWLWIMQARAGNPAPLLRQTTRNWVIDSIATGWPPEQIENILREAEQVAFEADDYAKTAYLRSIKTRVLNAGEFQLQKFELLTECALVSSGNKTMIDVLADGIERRSEKEILSLCRAAETIKPEVCEEARCELARRINLWLELRHRPVDEFIALSLIFVESLSFAKNVNAKDVMRFIHRFTDGQNIFDAFLESLLRARRVDVLEQVHSAIDIFKKPNWRSDCLDTWLRAGTVDCVDLIPTSKRLVVSELSPFAACWFSYHKLPTTANILNVQRPAQMSDPNDSYGRNFFVEKYLYQLFFWELADGLRNPSGTKTSHLKSGDFIDVVVNLVVDTARNIASGKSQLSFSTLYFAAREIAPISNRRYNDPVLGQYFGFKHALRRIAIDLHIIKQPSGTFAPLTAAELEVGRSSKHWAEEAWLEEQLERNLPIQSSLQAAASLAAEVEQLDKNITQFSERAEKWVSLALFARLYDLPELGVLVRRACNCAVGYGWRKDPWMMDVLDMVAEVHEAGGAQGFPLLAQLVPIVDQITEFTDGDETNHCRTELIEVVGRIAPDKLPNFYAHHLDDDSFRYAEAALGELMKRVKPDDAVTYALARTFVDNTELSFLENLASRSVKASEVLAEQLLFLGGRPPKTKEISGSSTDNYGSRGAPPDVKKFKANEFSKLMRRLAGPTLGYEHQREAVGDWLLYWETQGLGRVALKSVKAFFESEDQTYDAESMLDLAYDVSQRIEGKKAAYYWLVKAHTHRNGWQSHWTSEAEIMARLRKAASNYKGDWKKFIHDTSVQTGIWRRRAYDFSLGTKYLVRYLLLVGQNQIAADFAKTCVRIVKEEVSDQPLPDCPWFR